MNDESILTITTSLNGHVQTIEQAARAGKRSRRVREAQELMQAAHDKLLADLEARREEGRQG